jgi:ketosteroid isomerase-like protein
MSKPENVVRSLYAALERGDVSAALGLMDPHIKWTEASRSPYYHGETEGTDAIVQHVLEPIGRDFETFTITAKEFMTDGDRCAAFGTYGGRVRSTGCELHADFVHVWTTRGDLIVGFRQYTDTAAWSEAFSLP